MCAVTELVPSIRTMATNFEIDDGNRYRGSACGIAQRPAVPYSMLNCLVGSLQLGA